MIPTKNDLPEPVRKAMSGMLNGLLADCIDLQTQIKQAHWNVKGPNFIGLHKLFDEIGEEVEDYVDDIAERVVQLGGVAEGTARIAAARSTLAEYPLTITAGRDHVQALSLALAAFGKSVRVAIDTASNAGDADTADLCTEVSRGIDKWLWFVEAHQQADS
jgi:starvation-inducible DNA-binding protein